MADCLDTTLAKAALAVNSYIPLNLCHLILLRIIRTSHCVTSPLLSRPPIEALHLTVFMYYEGISSHLT